MDSLLFVHFQEGKISKQIIFLPYLGGCTTAFKEIVGQLDDDYDIWVANPPGHLASCLELVDDMTRLVDLYYAEIIKIMKEECTLFGYSMGGNIVYFLAQKLIKEETYRSKLKSLIIAASAPPCTYKGKVYSTLPRKELIEHISSYGGMSEEILSENELLDIFLPIFRADYKVLETGENIFIEKPLLLPTYLICGEDDSVEPVECVNLWFDYLGDKVKIFPIRDAGHMFINSHKGLVIQLINMIVSDEFVTEFERNSYENRYSTNRY